LIIFVIPAQAGIQLFQCFLDTGLRRYDDCWTFYWSINYGTTKWIILLKIKLWKNDPQNINDHNITIL